MNIDGKAIERISRLRDSYIASAEVEEILVEQMKPILKSFDEGERSDWLLMRMQIRNEANGNARDYRQKSEDLTALLNYATTNQKVE